MNRKTEPTPQLSFAALAFAEHGHLTARERFLEKLDQVIDWRPLVALVRELYPDDSPAGGRPRYPLPPLVRLAVAAWLWRLSDAAAVDLVIESESVRRRLLELDAWHQPPPSVRTFSRFRSELAAAGLEARVGTLLVQQLAAVGLRLRRGRISEPVIRGCGGATSKGRGERLHPVTPVT
jgi:hypothetical protein